MAAGTIKWFDKDKGFGFIDRGDDDEDLWFHAKDRDRSAVDEAQLLQGVRVEFEVNSNGRGPKGCITRILNGSQPEPAAQEAGPSGYTEAEALAGLRESLLITLQWVDVLDGLRQAGKA